MKSLTLLMLETVLGINILPAVARAPKVARASAGKVV